MHPIPSAYWRGSAHTIPSRCALLDERTLVGVGGRKRLGPQVRPQSPARHARRALNRDCHFGGDCNLTIKQLGNVLLSAAAVLGQLGLGAAAILDGLFDQWVFGLVGHLTRL